ncbi:hypothetical protein SK128_008563 [Halocaridina rubra]|uniref:Uncharacterized protein n=1 Tax=Halocaridina rubra TaxID=373956 RepID=A0AAN8X1W3_HALRR
MSIVSGILLGVAEIKSPLRRLPQNDLVHIANLAYQVIFDNSLKDQSEHSLENTNDDQLEQSEKQRDELRNAIGALDYYYAMQEVDIHLQEGLCEVKRHEDVVLRHRVADVIIITSVEGIPHRIIYMCRNDSFGRAAMVLQMHSVEDVEKLKVIFPMALFIARNNNQSSEKNPTKSWGRNMGKKISSMMETFTATSLSIRRSFRNGEKSSFLTTNTNSPMTTRKIASESDRASLTDSDSDDEIEFSCTDDTDSTAGTYYEDMGIDAKIQEKLYDTLDSVSRSSINSVESKTSGVEAEIKFFIESDGEFVKSLQSLEEDRRHLATDDKPQFIRNKLALLFMQVKPLIQLHTELHHEFCKSDKKIIPICQTIIDHQVNYESYIYFMENIPIVDDIMQDHRDFFQTCVPDLYEKLRKPRMRLHYYVLTLDTVYKLTTSSEEKEWIYRAMEVLKIPLKRADSKLFLGAIIGAPFDLSNFGNIIRHSDLRLRKGGDLPQRNYHVVALKSLIILTVSKGKSYQYITSFRMDEVSLMKAERGVRINLQVRNGPRGSSVHHVFKAKNIAIQQKWISDLKEILSEKTQNSTPRNSMICVESDFNSSGRRSAIRRGPSFDRRLTKSVSQTSSSDTEDMSLEQDGSLNSGNSRESTVNKRPLKRRESSGGDRQRPIVRKNSGGNQTAESAATYLKGLSWRLPLTVRSFIPENTEAREKEKTEGHVEIMNDLSEHESKYQKNMQEQLGSFLNEGLSLPPHSITKHFRHIYKFHESKFSPAIEQGCSSQSPYEIAVCFVNYASEFIMLYSEYFADRIALSQQMENEEYKMPINQFALYTNSLRKLKVHAKKNVENVIDEALAITEQCIDRAESVLISEAVCGAPFDLSECGPVLHEGLVKVRWPGAIMKQEMCMVLLNDMILLLEYRSPLYHYVESIRMDIVGMGPSSDDFTFQVDVRKEATKLQTFSFRVRNKKEKEEWVKEITHLLSKQVELLKEKLKKKMANEIREMKVIESSEEESIFQINRDGQNVSIVRKKVLETSL